jgi:hypothetical protein
MNQPLTYEQLIAQKLQELDVPDQANVIWATIEQQLNIEMPANGNNSSGSGGFNNPNRWIGGGSLFTLIVAIVTYIFISKQNLESPKNLKEKPATIQQQHEPLQNKEDLSTHSLKPVDVDKKPETVRDNVSPREEETEQTSPGTETVKSSPKQREAEKIEIIPPQADTVVERKKPRGVRGISDADYRLVPSPKDSTKN